MEGKHAFTDPMEGSQSSQQSINWKGEWSRRQCHSETAEDP